MNTEFNSSSCNKWPAGIRTGTAFALLFLLLLTTNALPDETPLPGKALAADRSKGNCLACHVIEDGELPGNLGPPLVVMQARFPAREKLRKQIYDASLLNPLSRMPPFGRHQILTADEIELIMDYLYTL
jgi:L-cysteine S-thiosulfotransferase